MPDPVNLTPTLEKFEYPNLLVKDFSHWSVNLRRHQVTLGSLVLISTSDTTAFSDLGQDAFSELKTVTSEIEQSLQALFGYDKINYLMLMMNDPNPHFHVLPRYGRVLSFEGMDFGDAGWPKPPDLASGPTLEDDMAKRLIQHLKTGWRDSGGGVATS